MVLDSTARSVVEVVHVKSRVPWSLVQKSLLPGDEDLVLQVWDAVIARELSIRSEVQWQPLSSLSVKKSRHGQCGCCERVGPRFFGGEECGDKNLTPGFVWLPRETLGHDCNQPMILYYRGVNSIQYMKMSNCNNHSQK